MDISFDKSFQPSKIIQWRTWLEKKHKRQSEVWLIFYKKATGKQTITYQQALDEALCFGWIDGIEKGVDSERYAIRFTPRAKNSNWSKINKNRYKELLNKGLITPSGAEAFNNKRKPILNMSDDARQWHKTHKMPKNPTLLERVEWHKEHLKYCHCASLPKSIEQYIK